jgi:signal transduction histidine kinase
MGRFDGLHRQRAVDWAVPLGAFALTLVLLLLPDDSGRSFDLPGLVLAALASLPLALRRRAPIGVFVFMTAASSLLFALEYPAGPPVGPTVGVYNIALRRAEVRGSQKLTIGLIAAMFLVHVGSSAIAHGSGDAGFVLGIPLWGAAWFAGDRTRLRRERIAELEERARRAELEAERERRLAAAEERTRIARDLHDSAGHAINVILVQAGAARLLAEKDAERSRAALETIESVARETLQEIDQLVRALREDDGDGAVEPPVGLAALDTLVQRHRTSGRDLSVEVRGAKRTLPPAVDQAAYRILQESLTNAMRHGRGSTTIELAYEDDALALAVANAAGGAAAPAGHGIVGMRERAQLLGGSLEAGAVNGVFRVRARLPYAAVEQP